MRAYSFFFCCYLQFIKTRRRDGRGDLMIRLFKRYLLHLQQFADGAAGDTGDTSQAAAENTGEGASQVAAAGNTETKATFEELIKGEYKEDYDKAVQKIVRSRFAKAKANEDKLAKLGPVLQALASKYGTEADDIDSIAKYVGEDDELYEEAAYKAGLTVDQYKRIAVIEAENQRLKAEKEAAETRRAQNEWFQARQAEADQLKSEFPDFDLDAMMQNENFVRLIHPQNPYAVGIREAYLALKADEILPDAMEHTARTVARKTAQTIAQRGHRPAEGGMSGQASSKAHADVSRLTDSEIADYVKRASRGEFISF